MSLPVVIVPDTEESLAGYLMRVCQRNVIPDTQRLLASLGLKLRLTYDFAQLACIATELAVDVAVLLARNPVLDSGDPLLRTKFQRGNFQPVCPCCLSERQVLRQAWAHDLITACPRHGLQLVEQCPRCNTRLSMQRGRVDVCGCGQLLTSIPSRAASEAELATAALLCSLEHPARQALPEALRHGVPPPDIAGFLVFLAAHLSPQALGQSKPRKTPRPKSITEAIVEVDKAWSVLASWPRGLEMLIDQRLALSEGPGLAKRLGTWYRMLHKEFSDPAYDFVRHEMGRLAGAKFDGHLNLRLSSIDPSLLTEKCWMTPREAARLIGIGPSLLSMAVTTGEIKGKVTTSGANRYISLHRDVVQKIRSDRLDYLTATEVRKRLGVSKVLFERLMQAGALAKKTKKQRPPLVSAEFLARDVDRLITRLKAGLRPQEIPLTEQVGMHDISARRGVSNDRICSVLQQILRGDVRPISSVDEMPGIAGLRFDLRQIKTLLLDDETVEPRLLITDLSRMMGWKHETILAWIAEGLLSTVEEVRGRQVVTLIPVSAVFRFQAQYVVLADVARRIGSSSNWILRGLMPAGVKPVPVPHTVSGARRGVLLRLEDVMRAAQLNKRAAPISLRDVQLPELVNDDLNDDLNTV